MSLVAEVVRLLKNPFLDRYIYAFLNSYESGFAKIECAIPLKLILQKSRERLFNELNLSCASACRSSFLRPHFLNRFWLIQDMKPFQSRENRRLTISLNRSTVIFMGLRSWLLPLSVT